MKGKKSSSTVVLRNIQKKIACLFDNINNDKIIPPVLTVKRLVPVFFAFHNGGVNLDDVMIHRNVCKFKNQKSKYLKCILTSSLSCLLLEQLERGCINQ